VGVWYGFPYPVPLSDVKGNPAVQIWRDAVRQLHPLAEQESGVLRKFPMAQGVIRVSYCRDSGGLPTEACRCDLRGDRCDVGYFVQGSEPRLPCHCHALREWDRAGDCPATEQTPPEERMRVGLLQLPGQRRFPIRVAVIDERYRFR
jgi:hypothetical protein